VTRVAIVGAGRMHGRMSMGLGANGSSFKPDHYPHFDAIVDIAPL
jgi:hypothetical protein